MIQIPHTYTQHQKHIHNNNHFRTKYDTCYRAKTIFGLDTALLVTQRFHLPRALYLCDMLGMETLGVEAENCYWTGSPFIWNVREFLATVAAFLDLYVSSPSPVLGNPEPIFVD
jgi:SanA protein